MSYLSLLFTSKVHAMSPAARESRNSMSEIGMEDWDTGSPLQGEEGERVLPLGIHSLEHWLDLNA